MPGSWREGGWKEKYIITKTDGSDIDPNAVYFVLRLDADPNARIAGAAYAAAVAIDNDNLATDVFNRVYARYQNPDVADRLHDRGISAIRELQALVGDAEMDKGEEARGVLARLAIIVDGEDIKTAIDEARQVIHASSVLFRPREDR